VSAATVLVPEAELRQLVQLAMARAGVDSLTAEAIAHSIVSAERDGTPSHGLLRVTGYLASIKSGWVDASARMTVRDVAPGVVVVDANNGFSQGALVRGRGVALQKCQTSGVSILALHNAHHFGALWPDAEWFAEQGVLCMAFVNSRSRIVAPGAAQKVLGTNPMALAAPAQPHPIVWDQASSVMAHGDVILAAREGRHLDLGVAVDAQGHATIDPHAVLNGGGLLPFGAHKGFMIALLVEILAAAVTGSRFGFEDTSVNYPGAQTSNGGQLFILVDATKIAGPQFEQRLALLLEHLREAGSSRMPGDRRQANRVAARAEGIRVRQADLEQLR
jgi:delta1-piperideine-2-carboxylate reductase